MKKLLLLFVLLFSVVHSQINWLRMEEPYGGSCRATYVKGDTMLLSVNKKIYFSTNGGRQWHEAQIDIRQEFVSFTHSNDTTFFAVTSSRLYKSYNLVNWIPTQQTWFESLARDKNGYIYANRETLVFRSANNGLSWQLYYELSDNYFPFFLITEKTIFITGSGVIHRRRLSDQEQGKNMWTVIRMPQYFNPIRLSTDNRGRIYGISTGNSLMACSSDDGETWSYIDLGISFPNIQPAGGIVFDGHTIIINNSIWDDREGAQMYRSTDLGATWSRADKGLPPGIFITELSRNGKRFFAATDGAGLFTSTDNGESWSALRNGINELYVQKIVQTRNEDLYIASLGRGILKSTDLGKHWIEFNDGLDDYNADDIVVTVEDQLYASTWKRIYTRDGGTGDHQWEKIRDAQIGPDQLYLDRTGRLFINTGFDYKVSPKWAVFFDGFDPGGIAITRYGTAIVTQKNFQQIHRSTDNGSSWSLVFQYTHPMYKPLLDQLGHILVPGKNIVKSTDDGQTWYVVSSGLTNKFTIGLFCDMKGSYYCSTRWGTYGEGKFYYSNEEGENWTEVTGPLLNTEVNDMLFSVDGTFLATDRGLWKRTETVEKTASDLSLPYFELLQNYPNPFNPTTTIKYTVPSEGLVTLKIYDILGREVETLVNEEQNSGSYEVPFDAGGLASGIYFYKLNAGNYSDVKKMQLLK